MAYYFINDGGPNAADFSNNYIPFNEKAPGVLRRLAAAFKNCHPDDPAIRSRIEQICRASFEWNEHAYPKAVTS